MQVTFWGTRGSISTPGRRTEKYGGNTPCVSVHFADSLLILDAGTGIRNLGQELVSERDKNSDTNPSIPILLSHTHWDHIQGLPFFQPADTAGSEICIYGSSKRKGFLEEVLSAQMGASYFPIGLSELAGEIKISEMPSGSFTIGRFTIDWQEQHFHSGGSVRYRLSTGEKRLVYATDVELDPVIESETGNGKYVNQLRDYMEFVEDADLLIADGQFTEEEYSQRKGWGHTSIPVIVELARKCRVKQLAIFHHDPQHSDHLIDGLWRVYSHACSASSSHTNHTNVFWAREGMTLAI
jgi:phosphoribosyl 1,2-cyclic phosphodiesterase